MTDEGLVKIGCVLMMLSMCLIQEMSKEIVTPRVFGMICGVAYLAVDTIGVGDMFPFCGDLNHFTFDGIKSHLPIIFTGMEALLKLA